MDVSNIIKMVESALKNGDCIGSEKDLLLILATLKDLANQLLKATGDVLKLVDENKKLKIHIEGMRRYLQLEDVDPSTIEEFQETIKKLEAENKDLKEKLKDMNAKDCPNYDSCRESFLENYEPEYNDAND